MKRTMKALVIWLVPGLVAMSVFAGCGALDESGSADKLADGGGTKVKVGYLHTIAVDDKLQLGLLEGYWKDKGIDIEPHEFQTGLEEGQALAGGSIDIAIMGGVTSNFPTSGPGKILFLNSLETGTAQLWVSPKSGAKSVADLKGKTIITTEGTTADIFLLRSLSKAGLTRKDVKVVNAKMPDAVQAFVSGSADAVALWVPFDLRVKEGLPGATQIDGAKNHPDAAVADGWVANTNWLAKNGDTAKKVVDGWLVANTAFRDDPEGSLKKVFDAAYSKDAKLADLQHQVSFQTDYTNDEWLKLYESGQVLTWVGNAEKAFVELGGVKKFVEPKTFFDTSLFIDQAKAAQKAAQ